MGQQWDMLGGSTRCMAAVHVSTVAHVTYPDPTPSVHTQQGTSFHCIRQHSYPRILVVFRTLEIDDQSQLHFFRTRIPICMLRCSSFSWSKTYTAFRPYGMSCTSTTHLTLHYQLNKLQGEASVPRGRAYSPASVLWNLLKTAAPKTPPSSDPPHPSKHALELLLQTRK
jgi:hypothetical protein